MLTEELIKENQLLKEENEKLKNELRKVKNVKKYMLHKTHLMIYRSYQKKKLNESILARFLILGRRFEITCSEK